MRYRSIASFTSESNCRHKTESPETSSIRVCSTQWMAFEVLNLLYQLRTSSSLVFSAFADSIFEQNLGRVSSKVLSRTVEGSTMRDNFSPYKNRIRFYICSTML
ncbi:hypothetical protein GCK32_018004 [Trichostrongylus colubriformis]|uniref:Uncharacterized protein n=1 Tax=Trichostrongylus colubriformis TaxID=6319 RepID=A0AAN8IRQ7_TRICO